MYRSLNNYLKEKFGCKVYKLAISGGMTCPNRDGTLSTDGCIFCSESGSGDFSEKHCNSVTEQIEKAKLKVAKKTKCDKYIAYFQDFTNTYAPIGYLKKIFTEAISHPDIAALSIATRPDCLPNEVLDLLNQLQKIKPIWVELGLQTIHPTTAKLINRQYDLPIFDRAVNELKTRGIEVIVHMIVGLPGETEEMIFKTAEYIGQTDVDGIKIHLLHVLKNTALAEMYLNGDFSLPTLEEYTQLVIGCIRRLPPKTVIHRITGDGAKKDLIAPLWSADKKTVLNYMNSEFKRQNLKQGELCRFVNDVLQN